MRWMRLVLVIGLLMGSATLTANAQDGTGASEAAGTSAPSAAPAATESNEGGTWVATHRPTGLWSDSSEGTNFGNVRQWTILRLTDQAADRRVYVFNPRTNNYAWVDAEAIGPSDAPTAAYLAAPELLYTVQKPGRTIGSYNMRSLPSVRDDTLVRAMGHNASVYVQEAVVGDDGETWYRVGDDRYIHSEGVRLPKNPPRGFGGRWLDVDLNEPALITAYEGDRVVYTALTIKGTAVDPTPTGVYRITRRVANEIMDSSTIGIPRNARGGYYLRDVLYTQYFTGGGASLHYNYWSSNFGYAGSHGCLGLTLADAEWFWNWAGNGTTLNVHY